MAINDDARLLANDAANAAAWGEAEQVAIQAVETKIALFSGRETLASLEAEGIPLPAKRASDL